MELRDTIGRRRSIRFLLPYKPVERDKIQRMLEAATLSSFWGNVHGGYGLSKDYHLEKLFRDARAALIEDGTNEVLGLAAGRMIAQRYGTT